MGARSHLFLHLRNLSPRSGANPASAGEWVWLGYRARALEGWVMLDQGAGYCRLTCPMRPAKDRPATSPQPAGEERTFVSCVRCACATEASATGPKDFPARLARSGGWRSFSMPRRTVREAAHNVPRRQRRRPHVRVCPRNVARPSKLRTLAPVRAPLLRRVCPYLLPAIPPTCFCAAPRKSRPRSSCTVIRPSAVL